eukprot:GEMP01019037.1.p1 GENE.GEMP01019037.1~~GEMP01019037.1.p1  ORF type:complete len:625 (+),score=107.13 GEMP01019037.1:169-2043(+)
MDTSTSSARDDEESPSESTIRRLRSPPSPVRRQAIQSGANTGDQFIPEEETNSVIAAAEGTPLHDAESPRRPLSPASCSMLHSGAQSGRSENDVDGRGQFVHQGIHAAGGLIRTPCYDVHGYRHAQPLASPCKRHNATQSGETGHRISGQFDGSMSGASAAELDEGDVRRGTSASWQEMQEPLRNFAQDEEAAARQHGPCNDAASSHGGAESVEKNEMLFFNAVECGTARSTRPRRRSSGAGRILSAFGVRCALRTDDSQVNGMEVEPVNDEGRSLTTMSGSVSIASLLVNVGMIMEPYALAQCGLALGVLVLTLVSFVILFNSFLMRRTLAICDALGEQNADLCVFAELAFGERGKKLVTAVFLMDLWAAQLTYYVIIAQCLRNFDESTETPLVVSGLLTVAMLHAPLSWITSFQKIGGLSIVTLLLALFFSGLSLETWPDPTYTNFTWRNVPSASSMMVYFLGCLRELCIVWIGSGLLLSLLRRRRGGLFPQQRGQGPSRKTFTWNGWLRVTRTVMYPLRHQAAAVVSTTGGAFRSFDLRSFTGEAKKYPGERDVRLNHGHVCLYSARSSCRAGGHSWIVGDRTSGNAFPHDTLLAACTPDFHMDKISDRRRILRGIYSSGG